MTTIVVHGTMTVRSAKSAKWWWDSWHEGGFLQSVAEGMEMRGFAPDLWRVNGTYVSEVPELNPSWSLATGRMGQVSQHKGHFLWSGAVAGFARDAGATALVRYLNTLSEITDEPIRIIAHSHGCNVVKNASSHSKLSPGVSVERAVFLACPHFYADAGGTRTFTYRLDPRRFGRILNLYTSSDTVQVGIANAVTGPPGARFSDWAPPNASRRDLDPAAEGRYENVEVPTLARKTRAHTVMHGSLVGGLSGMWLYGDGSFQDVLGMLPHEPPAVPAEDVGA